MLTSVLNESLAACTCCFRSSASLGIASPIVVRSVWIAFRSLVTASTVIVDAVIPWRLVTCFWMSALAEHTSSLAFDASDWPPQPPPIASATATPSSTDGLALMRLLPPVVVVAPIVDSTCNRSSPPHPMRMMLARYGVTRLAASAHASLAGAEMEEDAMATSSQPQSPDDRVRCGSPAGCGSQASS